MRQARKTKTVKFSPPDVVRTAMRDTGIIRVQAPFIILEPPVPIKKRRKKR